MDLETNPAGKQEVLVSGTRGKLLVPRTWFGRTRIEHADEYLWYNYENGVLEVVLPGVVQEVQPKIDSHRGRRDQKSRGRYLLRHCAPCAGRTVTCWPVGEGLR